MQKATLFAICNSKTHVGASHGLPEGKIEGKSIKGNGGLSFSNVNLP